MTTIVLYNGVIYADGKIISAKNDSILENSYDKILKFKDILFAGCGTVDSITLFYLKRLFSNSNFHIIKNCNEISILEYHIDGLTYKWINLFSIFNYSLYIKIKVRNYDWITLGSGGEYANKSMKKYKDPIKAILYASTKDKYTNDIITSKSLDIPSAF